MKIIDNKIRFAAIVLALMILHVSCKKILDQPDVNLEKDEVFTNINSTTQFLTNIYSELPNPLSPVSTTLYECATDDALYANAANSIFRLATGSWDATFNPDEQFANYYSAIRKCNIFLENIDQLPISDHGSDLLFNAELVKVLKPRMRAEAFFLRGFFYFELVKRYGSVPLILKSLSLNDSLNLPRTDYNLVFKQIASDCDSAFLYLPPSYTSTAGGGVNVPNYFGHATKWSAQALKSRVLLFAASPLFNENADATKWQDAINAALPFYNGTAPFSLTALANYEKMFYGNTTNSVTYPELILTRVAGVSNSLEKDNFPVGFGADGNGICPSQNLVNAFEMKSGLPITNPLAKYNSQKPDSGRDARLAANILYNGATYKGRTIQTFLGGGIDASDVLGGSSTGYYLKKLVSPNVNLIGTATSDQHHGIYFRLAEMLLNYAEAANELAATPGTDVYTAVNRVRQRVGQPALPAGITKDEMRTRIQNERRIELCFEGHRYWDARRWKIAVNFFNGPLLGMKVTKNGNAFVYEPYVVEQHVFLPKMNLYPVPLQQLQINNKLTQTPLW